MCSLSKSNDRLNPVEFVCFHTVLSNTRGVNIREYSRLGPPFIDCACTGINSTKATEDGKDLSNDLSFIYKYQNRLSYFCSRNGLTNVFALKPMCFPTRFLSIVS